MAGHIDGCQNEFRTGFIVARLGAPKTHITILLIRLVDPAMRSATFNVFGLATRRAAVGRYAEFLQAPTLHTGLYELEVGAVDHQKPHDDDEIYYVISGHASFMVEGKSQPVQPGDVIYVAAGEEHRFEDIEEDLKLLVIFGPPARDLHPD